MKTNYFKGLAVCVAAAGISSTNTLALAQDSSATFNNQAAPVADNAPPPLAYGATQILQLARARVGDDTIIAYIKNSGNSYALNADQIIYLQQQGLSSAVITTMLNQPRAAGSTYVPTPSTPAPPVTTTYDPQPASAPSSVGPAVTAIDPTAAAAASTTYYYPSSYYYPYYSYPYYPYPAYGFYPGVSISLGWGRGWGGGWHGGYGGGFHGGWHH